MWKEADSVLCVRFSGTPSATHNHYTLSKWDVASNETFLSGLIQTTSAVQYWPVKVHISLNNIKKESMSTAGSPLKVTTGQWLGPPHSLHFTVIQRFIDISRLGASPHAVRNPCPFKECHWQMHWTVLERFPLICFVWVCVCVCLCTDDLKSREGGWGGRDAVIRSGPLPSLCADKAGHTQTRTHVRVQTAIPEHERPITHLSVIFPWLCLPRQHYTNALIFFFLQWSGTVWGFNRAKLSLNVYKRWNARFILMKSSLQKQDFYHMKAAESYWSLMSAHKQDSSVNASLHLTPLVLNHLYWPCRQYYKS